jgi:hypothetical protein
MRLAKQPRRAERMVNTLLIVISESGHDRSLRISGRGQGGYRPSDFDCYLSPLIPPSVSGATSPCSAI